MEDQYSVTKISSFDFSGEEEEHFPLLLEEMSKNIGLDKAEVSDIIHNPMSREDLDYLLNLDVREIKKKYSNNKRLNYVLDKIITAIDLNVINFERFNNAVSDLHNFYDDTDVEELFTNVEKRSELFLIINDLLLSCQMTRIGLIIVILILVSLFGVAILSAVAEYTSKN